MARIGQIVRNFRIPGPVLALAAVLASTLLTAPAAFGVTLIATPNQLTFLQNSGVQSPPSQTVSITSVSPSNALITVSGSGASWLFYSQSSATAPSILTVNVLPSGLAIGTYTASINVSSPGATTEVINVTLTVTVAPPSQTNPTQLDFTYTTGGSTPPSQQFYVNNNSSTFSIGVNQSWIFASVNSGTLPATVNVFVNPTGLLPGTYNGLVTVSFATNPVTFQLVNVSLTIDAGSQNWTVSGPVLFSHKYGDPAPQSQQLSIAYTSVVIYIANVTAPETTPWLKILNNTETGVTPANVEVSVDPTGLVAGTYNGSITLSTPGVLGSFAVPVTLVITGAPALSVSPSSLEFQGAAGGAQVSKTVSLASTPTTGYVASVAVGSAWLSATPSTGNTPQTLTVTVSPASLGPGTYRGSILFSAPGASSSSQLLSVTLVVTGSVTLSASPTQLQFTSSPTGGDPPAQSISVSSNLTASVAAASTPGWLMVTPLSANTPATFSVSVVTAGLAAGSYSGTITVSSPGAGQTIQIPVTLNVGGAKPTITDLSNGAGLLKDFAPGSQMTIFGNGLGPATQVVATLNSARQLPQILAGVQVFMNNIAVPLLTVSSTQVQCMVPFEIAGQGRIDIQVVYQSVRSDTTTVALLDNAPILFTADGSGRGRASIVNQNGSLNAPGSGAPRGTAIQIYGDGGGLFVRDVLSGSVVDSTGQFRATTSVFIGGTQADVLYAGPAPGQIAGIFQINAYVPQEIIPGSAVSITIRVGTGFTQQGVTMAVE
ncbi:MAG: hypothetical protein ABI972_13665 [Acidobacteriota bacterium]